MTADQPYQRLTAGEYSDGEPKVLNARTRQMLDLAERRLGYPLTIVQGSYHKGVGASAGTHDGGGAVDLLPYDWERKVHVLREIGFAAWHRLPSQGPWEEHVHCVALGDQQASAPARQQMVDYHEGRDGLADDRTDAGWRPDPLPTYRFRPDGLRPPQSPLELVQHLEFAYRRAIVQLQADHASDHAWTWMDHTVASAKQSWAELNRHTQLV